jgi:hypothetical protein
MLSNIDWIKNIEMHNVAYFRPTMRCSGGATGAPLTLVRWAGQIDLVRFVYRVGLQ